MKNIHFRNLLLSLILSCHQIMAFSTQFTKETQQLSSINTKINTLNQAQKESSTQKNSSINKLKTIDLKIANAKKMLYKTENEILELKSSIIPLEQSLLALKNQFKNNQQKLSHTLMLSNNLKSSQPITLLLNKKDPSLTNRLMIYIAYINKYQSTLLQETMALQKEIQKKQTLTFEKISSLNHMIKNHQKILTAYHEGKDNQKQFIDKVNATILNRNKKIQQLKSDKNRLDSVLKKMVLVEQRKTDTIPFNQLKYQLPWPIKRTLKELSTKASTELSTNGIYIKTNEGRQVSAVRSGRVVFSEWLKGYGLLIILQHDLGFMTLYANNQLLYKEKGDRVYTGDKIADVGRSGGRAQSGLYFEIRKNAKALPPLAWLKPLK